MSSRLFEPGRPRRIALTASAVVGAVLLAGCGGGGGAATARSPRGPARLTARLSVRPAGAHIWRSRIAARPGEITEHRLDVVNIGGGQATRVRARVALGAGERPVFASAYIKRTGVAVANSTPLPPGLFGRGVSIGPLPGGGTIVVITFKTRVGHGGPNESASVRWNTGTVTHRIHG